MRQALAQKIGELAKNLIQVVEYITLLVQALLVYSRLLESRLPLVQLQPTRGIIRICYNSAVSNT